MLANYGNVLLEHRADERFMSTSNMKLFTTAAVLSSEARLTALDTSTQAWLEEATSGLPDLVIVGRGTRQ